MSVYGADIICDTANLHCNTEKVLEEDSGIMINTLRMG